MSDRSLMSFIYVGLILGLVYRLFPIVAGQPYLSQFFMTEDGYLMLTVARNMAIGLGMTVSDGTIPTNGVQPLATFLFAVPYWLTGGDKVQSLVGIHLIAASAAVGGFFAIRALAARVLAPRDDDPVWPWLVALLWFVGPLLLDHTMNALETGIYTFVAVLALLKFAQVLEKGAAVSMRDCLALGALSGITFLARNDGAFLVTAIFAVWALDSLFRQGIGIARTVGRLVPPGVLSLLIAAPWLINNKVHFGSIVPISGWSQAFGATFGQNLPLIPIKLFEHMFPMLPVPTSMENSPFVIWGCAAVVLGVMGWFLRAVWTKGGTIRLVVIAYVLHGIALSAYYGLNFGAPHFVSRYLSVLSPLLIIAALWCGMDLFRAVTGERWRTALRLASVSAVLLSVALLGRPFLPGANGQGHFQVVDWIEANVPSDVWVGAVQTGTLGYWHDRTINLDGKVNPEALAALQTEGDILNYVSKSQIIYLADWHGIARWVEKNDFDQVFEVVTHQPDINLAVLKRRGAP